MNDVEILIKKRRQRLEKRLPREMGRKRRIPSRVKPVDLYARVDGKRRRRNAARQQPERIRAMNHVDRVSMARQ